MCLPKKYPKILAAWVLANVSRRSVLKTFRFYPVLQMLLHTVKSCDKYFSVNIKYLKNKRMAVLSLVIRWLSATSVFIIMYGTQSKTQSPVSGFYSQIICEMVLSKKKKKNPRSHQLGILYAIMIHNLLWVINGKIYVASPGLLVSDISPISVYSK